MSDFDLTIDQALVLAIDLQERFVPAIPAVAAGGPVAERVGLLLDGAALLGLPVVFSEQYPKGLGPTVSHLRDQAADAPVYAKTAFSCCDDEALRLALAERERPWLLVCGIEAHVCVLATVDDCLRRGWRVAVAADGIASRDPANVDHAIATMRQLGAVVLPVESLLFRLQRAAGSERFKALARLVK